MQPSDIVTIFSSGAVSVALSGGLLWLVRNWISDRLKASIQHEYEQKLETHKAQLRSQTETEIVRLKAQLEIVAAERQVQYSRVFEKTAEVIAETYKRLLAVKDAADDYTQMLSQQTPEQKGKLVEAYRQRTQEFLGYFLPNKIYVPKETAEKIRLFSNTLHAATSQFSMAMADSKSPHRNPETVGRLFDKYFETTDAVPKLLSLLEDEFQKLLGLAATHKSVI